MFALLALGLPALAFQPAEHHAQEVRPERTLRFHIERQHALRTGDAWTEFTSTDGAGWQASFDEWTGTAHRAWGPGIQISGRSPTELAAGIRTLLSEHPDLAGVDVSTLRLAHSRTDKFNGATHLRLIQVLPGNPNPDGTAHIAADGADLPPLMEGGLTPFTQDGGVVVWGAEIRATIANGAVTFLALDTHPAADQLDRTPVLSGQTAIDAAIAASPRPDAAHDVDGAVLVVLPRMADAGLEYRLVWMVRTHSNPTGTAPIIWASMVDAHTGELLAAWDQVAWLDGSVYGSHDTRTVNGDFSVSAMPDLPVSSADGTEYTDRDGGFAADGGDLSATLSGAYFNVKNAAGSEGSMSWASGDATFTTDDATQAEIDSYVFLSQIRAWGEAHAAEVDLVYTPINSNVNMSDVCNAYFDGDVNFFVSGSGCNNTGRIADVNFHEWGHGLHAYAADTWWVDGSVGEGAGDITSFLQTGDHIVAPYFMTNGSGIREVATDRSYPDDIVGEVHTDGLIWAGAVWDLRTELYEMYDDDDALAHLSRMFVGTLQANPDTEETYDGMVASDDDDGDLSNGTPHQCEIISAFSPHGLGPAGSLGVVTVGHEPLRVVDPELSSYAVDASIVNLAPDCIDVAGGDGTVWYSVDDGASWSDAPLLGDNGSLTGDIPSQPAGTIVQYYLTVDADGSELTTPSGGTINPFTFVVGELEEIYCNDFEDDDGGYSHALIAGEDGEGADDWLWGRPQGTGGDPDFAASGTQVWGNDLGGGNFNGEYQNNKTNRLTSAPIDIDPTQYAAVVLQYERWLTVEDGIYDQASILMGEELLWTNHASSQNAGDEHHADAQWVPHTLLLPIEAPAEVQLSWQIDSDGGLSMGGWNVDDVCVYGVIAGDADPDVDPNDDPEMPDDHSDDGPSNGLSPDADGGELTGCGCSSSGQRGVGGLLAALLGGMVFVLRRRR